MKYDVKNEHGQLTFGSLRELYVLYQRQFVSDDDLVSRHGADQWVPAGQMPELKGARDLVADKSTPVWGALFVGYLVLIAVLLLRYGGSSGWIWLFGLSALVLLTAAFGLVAWQWPARRARRLASAEPGEARSALSTNEAPHGQGQGPR